MTSSARGRGRSDGRIVLWLVGGMALAIALFSVVRPPIDPNDPRPIVTNVSSGGTKAAYLLMPQLGYGADRWDEPVEDLRKVDAGRTTLIETEPDLPFEGLQKTQAAVKDFLERGGRVVATGADGARLLPGGRAAASTKMYKGLCETTPEGFGPIAAVGTVYLDAAVKFAAEGPQFHVAERCGDDAAVVWWRVGKGEAVWWSSAMPMTNSGLKQDAGLRLLLASVGGTETASGERTVLFDEYLHERHETVAGDLNGLPWGTLLWEGVGLVGLVLLSFARRRGPVRPALVLPRTSPVEFADSMGQLYAKAGATSAATGAALGRLLQYLQERCGLPAEVVRGPAEGIGEALRERLGGDWRELAAHVQAARDAEGVTLRGKSALRLVQELEGDERALESVVRMSVAGR